MTLSQHIPQTPDELEKAVRTEKTKFDSDLKSLKREYTELMQSLKEQKHIHDIKTVWTDQNE